MSFTFPTTPVKQKSLQPEAQPSSCLKNNGNDVQLRESANGHKHSISQVRFSLPAKSDGDHEYEQNPDIEKKNPELTSSPTKVVYPRSSDANTTSHFVDFQHKVMVDVPEHIWQSHYNNRKSGSPCSSPTRPHKRTQSLQSVIADTLQTYHTKFTKEEPKLMADPDLPHLPPAELYLRSDSPLNKYKVAVPLEASLPPYLSPENKSKRRNSLVYDGQGYSTFLGDSGDEDSILGSPEADQSSSQYSDLSIPSATHDYSFDAKEDVDQLLGIDEDANVSLKKQARNLLNKSFIPARKQLPSLPEPPSFVAAKEQQPFNENHQMTTIASQGPTNHSQSEALRILGSPSKTITIPSLDQAPPPSSRSSLSHFMTQMNDELPLQDYQPSTASPKDEMNTTFQFPSPSKPQSTESRPLPTSDAHDIKTNSAVTSDAHREELKPLATPDAHHMEAEPLALSVTQEDENIENREQDNSFERRRKILRQQSDGSNFRRHTHNRSRSIHGSEDFFNGLHSQHHSDSNQPPSVTVPERSPRRSTAANAKMLDNGNFTSSAASTPTKNHSKSKASSVDTLSRSIATLPHNTCDNRGKKTGSTLLSTKFGESDKSPSVQEVEKPDSFILSDLHSSERSSSTLKPTTSLATEFFESQDLNLSGQSLNSTEINTSQEETDGDKSLEIIGERKIEKVTPLSTIQSFKAPLEFPPVATTTNPLEFGSGLAPSRQLSNNVSQSSNESKDSIPSRPSTSTAYSQEPTGSLSPLFTQISPKKTNSFVTKKFSKASPLNGCGLSESAPLRPRTLQEYIGDELVDVILLEDSDEDIAVPHRARPKSFHEDALKHFSEILELCDKTADRAKDVILDLVTIPASKNTGKVGDGTGSNAMIHDNKYSSHAGTQFSLQTQQYHLDNVGSSPSRYVSNLDRLRVLGKKR
ncbi:LAFA_0D01662g1_1 [Lachancea sp. 'fantastica']|nr:LAFA_0D01662g1_1 [Lachancea sp. 'fantastica']